MRKFLFFFGMILFLSATAPTALSSSSKLSFYVGLGGGWGKHDISTEIKLKANASKTIENIQNMMKEMTSHLDKTEQEKQVLKETVKKSKNDLCEALFAKFEIINPNENGVPKFRPDTWVDENMAYGSRAGELVTRSNDFLQIFFKAYIKESASLNDVVNTGTAALKQKYNQQIKENINFYVEHYIENSPFFFSTEKIYVTNIYTSEGFELKELGKNIYDESTNSGSFIKGKEAAEQLVKIETQQEIATLYPETRELLRLSHSNLNTSYDLEKSTLKGANGFIGEIFIGIDYKISNNIITGVSIYGGYDNSLSNNFKAENEIHIKSKFYAGCTPKIGFLIKNNLELFVMLGGQMRKYHTIIPTLSLPIPKNILKCQNMENGFLSTVNKLKKETEHEGDSKYAQYRALFPTRIEEFSTKYNEQLININIAASQAYSKGRYLDSLFTFNDTAKEYNEEKEIVINYPSQALSPNKMVYSFVLGGGIKYAFTPRVFGTMYYRYQFKTNAYKDYNINLYDQNHTIVAAIGIKLGKI